MRFLLVPALFLPVLFVLCAAGPADWPCVQRLVPQLTAATLWGGPEAVGDWRADARIAALVADVAPRQRPVEEGVARLERFAAALPEPGRANALALVFAGLVDATNAERTRVVENLRGLARRQRDLTGTVARVTAELRALPPDAPAAQREEVAGRRAFLIRDYEEVERTLRYACEVPGQMEARLGRFAQALRQGSEAAR
jgi:hypothetical protein